MTHYEHYQHLLTLSQKMLDDARHEQWEQVVARSEDYVEAVEQLKTLPAPTATAAADMQKLQQLLGQILANDKQIRQLAAPELRRLGGLLGEGKRQRKVVDAYCAPSTNQ